MENTFSKNLKRIRTEKGMNQSELAERMGYKQVTISAWEVGRSEPSMGDIFRIAKILNCTEDELIGIKKKMGNISFEDVLVKVNDLNFDELVKLHDVVKNQLDKTIEIRRLEEKRKEHEMLLKEYTDRLNQLKGL